MTRVDFYLLPVAEENGKSIAVCKLVHKAYRLGHRVYILAPTREHAADLDQLLWTFAAGSFIPHKIYSEPLDPQVPVLVGHEPPPAAFTDVLIPLTTDVPECFTRFARVAELVAPTEIERAAARERFRFYRERGHDVQTHNL
ncbi:MAG: DNA polymerase III subunit chi [Gammaproteobacteria bacterium]|nr:DNA polymerase III subunit chi [Gammaproteobacteria bacterium]